MVTYIKGVWNTLLKEVLSHTYDQKILWDRISGIYSDIVIISVGVR